MFKNFETSLISTLAHSVVFFVREEHSPNGIVNDARNGGDKAVKPSESTDEMMLALTKNLPAFVNVSTQAIAPTEEALLNSRRVTAPQEQELNLQLMNQFAPALNAVNRGIHDSNARNQVSLENDLLSRGRSNVERAKSLDDLYNPEAARAKSVANTHLEGLNPGMSGSERAEVERFVNRNNTATGNASGASALNTISNAMQFGNAGRASDTNKLASLTGILPMLKNNADTFNIATGRPTSSDFGANRFTGTGQGTTGNAGLGLAGNLSNMVGGFTSQAMDINSKRRDSLDRFNETMGSMPSYS